MTTQAAGKFAEMTVAIVEINKAHGWHDNPPSFPEAMAMMHSEVSEALEAWRDRGLDSWFSHTSDGTDAAVPPKPEGVPSEFADIAIRWLDDCYLFGFDAELVVASGYVTEVSQSFVENIDTLHVLIARASEAWLKGRGGFWRYHLAGVMVFLRALCAEYDIDLEAEVWCKIAYNRTRPFKHGGKRI